MTGGEGQRQEIVNEDSQSRCLRTVYGSCVWGPSANPEDQSSLMPQRFRFASAGRWSDGVYGCVMGAGRSPGKPAASPNLKFGSNTIVFQKQLCSTQGTTPRSLVHFRPARERNPNAGQIGESHASFTDPVSCRDIASSYLRVCGT